MNTTPHSCWVCKGTNVRLHRKGNTSGPLLPEQFRITDSDYGITGDIYECNNCGFLFCPDIGDVLQQYTQMSDVEYEQTRAQRALQARKILKNVSLQKPSGELLDIGAGSGILVEEALKLSYTAMGIEPSIALSTIARERELPVRTGTLPQPELHNRFDIVTLIDVIEHVDNPAELLSNAVMCMKPGAICVIVTPDVNSLAARLVGKKWWHYRLAHIGYFNCKTLHKITASTNLDIIATHRPAWYFPADYLTQRVLSYILPKKTIELPIWLNQITVPLNLFDSLLVICQKKQNTHQA